MKPSLHTEISPFRYMTCNLFLMCSWIWFVMFGSEFLYLYLAETMWSKFSCIIIWFWYHQCTTGFVDEFTVVPSSSVFANVLGRLCWFFIWLLEFCGSHLALQLSCVRSIFIFFLLLVQSLYCYWSVWRFSSKTQGVAEEQVGRQLQPQAVSLGLCLRSPTWSPLLHFSGSPSEPLFQPGVCTQTSGSQSLLRVHHPVSGPKMEKSQVSVYKPLEGASTVVIPCLIRYK